MANHLTVLIPARNEARNIRPCIESALPIADEILLADSGSTDRTADIARELGARVIEREYVNPSDFKNWAMPQAAHDWVLLLDADERVTPELAREILAVLRAPDRDAYWIPRRGYFFGRRLRRGGWGSDRVLRLVRRSVCRYTERRVHEELAVETGRIGSLGSALEHYTYWTSEQYFEKFDRYTTWGAQDLLDRGRRARLCTLVLRPAWRFFRQYLLKLGVLDGRAGLVMCGLSACSVFVKYAKLWIIREGLLQPDPEAARSQARQP